MRNLLLSKLFCLCLLFITLLFTASCSDDETDTTYSSITLRADKTSITADGSDMVTFTVYGDNQEDITDRSAIWIGQTQVEGKTYTTTSEGEVTFTATYKSLVSNRVTVTASNLSSTLTLKVSRPDLTADGQDAVTLTVISSGVDITESATISGDYSGSLSPGQTYSFSSSTAGSNTFYAEYEGVKSQPVYVSAVPENAQFYRMVGTFKSTSVWCEPCTRYNAELLAAEEELPGRMTQVVLHGALGQPDPFEPKNFREVNTGLIFGSLNYPSHNFDFRRDYLVDGYQPKEDVLETLNTILSLYPATTGIHVTSNLSGGKATAKITVRASRTDNYYMGAILVEDGLLYMQTQYKGDYTHNNTYRAALTPFKGIDLKRIEAGSSVTTELSVDLSTVEEIGNSKLVVYILDSESTISNATYAKLGGLTDFRYEN